MASDLTTEFQRGQNSIIQIIEDYRDQVKKFSDTKYYIDWMGGTDYWAYYAEAANEILRKIKKEVE